MQEPNMAKHVATDNVFSIVHYRGKALYILSQMLYSCVYLYSLFYNYIASIKLMLWTLRVWLSITVNKILYIPIL